MTALTGTKEGWARTLTEVTEAYVRATPGSAALHERATRSLPGGITGNLRYFPPHPLYFRSGEGSHVVDVDGTDYVDFFLGQGPLLLGHRHPMIQAAIEGQREIGSLVLNPPLIIEVAEAIQAAVPCAERVRLLNSGTEAVSAALRCARAFTGRKHVVKFLGHYHGQDDQLLLGVGGSPAIVGQGVSGAAAGQTIVARFGELDNLAQVLASSDDVAAVILDPSMHAGGLWGSTSEYLAAVRRLTAENGVVLIFDEVITGFRLALGGAQSYYGVTPDMATLGKALAAGEKLAAVAGRADVMAAFDPRHHFVEACAFQSGTGNDMTIPLLAAKAALEMYGNLERDGAYDTLAARSHRLASGLQAALRAAGIPALIRQLGPLLDLRLSEGTRAFEVPSESDAPWLQTMILALLSKGILLGLPTSGHVYLSFAHTDEDIEHSLTTVESTLDAYNWAASLGL